MDTCRRRTDGLAARRSTWRWICTTYFMKQLPLRITNSSSRQVKTSRSRRSMLPANANSNTKLPVGRHSIYYLPTHPKNEPNEDCTPIHGGSDGGHYLLRLRTVVISFIQPKNNYYSFLRPPQLVGHLCRTHLEEASQPVPKPTMGNRTRGETETTTSHSRQCGLIP